MRPRARAALIHLALSAAIAALVFLPIYFFWYPDVLFESAGGRDLFFLIVGVDVTIGPLITLIIFVPRKWGLTFDLVVIAILQTAALSYGVWVLFESRPVYIAYVVDRFELVRANGFPDGELEKAHAAGYDRLSWTGPRLIGVKLPTDPDESFNLGISGMNGVDAQYYPRYYVPYDDVRGQVKAKAQPIALLRKRNPKSNPQIDQVVAALGRKEADLRFIPMRAGRLVDLAVFVDPKDGSMLRMTTLNPWGE
ncbi:MAG TPA: TfpX/TfpZ family type IV pilin accessory protein [Usitatibacter sp.]